MSDAVLGMAGTARQPYQTLVQVGDEGQTAFLENAAADLLSELRGL